MYYEDLAEEEFNYLRGQRARITGTIEMATGLVPELRAEGVAMVDPFRKLTDYTMPEEGTDGHAALLLAEFMGQKLREPSAEQGVSVVELERFMMSCADEHGSRWRRDAREPAGVRMLLQKVLSIWMRA